jgi:murein DD-endopeptidase MepM/ murein hydrolase activator NlpD
MRTRSSRRSAQAAAVIAFFLSCQNEIRTAEDQGPPELPSQQSGEMIGRVAAEAPLLDETVLKGGAPSSGHSASMGFDATPLSQFVFPVVAGSFGSSWCVCRGIGTSPHVGQDIVDNGVGTQKSIAMSNGRVQSVSYDSSCGWNVTFRDSMGADWRFVHLNDPPVKVGQVVSRGALLGINQDYPKAGCGTGAHLHLERRSPGRFGSAEEFRSCQYGRQTCYYNPAAPIQNAMVVANEGQRATVVAKSPLKSSQNYPSSTLALSADVQGTLAGDDQLIASARIEPECKVFLRDIVPDELIDRSAHGVFSSVRRAVSQLDFVSSVEASPASSSGTSHEVESLRIALKVFLAGREGNACANNANHAGTSNRSSCIVSWTAQLVSEDGTTQSFMGATGAGDQVVEIPEDQGLCVRIPSSQRFRHLAISATTDSGEKIVVMIPISR